jgi:hypothetical protein
VTGEKPDPKRADEDRKGDSTGRPKTSVPAGYQPAVGPPAGRGSTATARAAAADAVYEGSSSAAVLARPPGARRRSARYATRDTREVSGYFCARCRSGAERAAWPRPAACRPTPGAPRPARFHSSIVPFPHHHAAHRSRAVRLVDIATARGGRHQHQGRDHRVRGRGHGGTPQRHVPDRARQRS